MIMQPDHDDESIISDTSSSAMTQDELKTNIKTLLEVDARIHVLNKEKKALDLQKKALSKDLMAVMKERAIDSFDTSKTRLLYKERTTRTMGKKTLIQTLQLYYKDDPDAVAELQQFIFENLPERTTETLTLRPKK